MEENSLANQTGRLFEPQARLATKNHSIDHEQTKDSSKRSQEEVGKINNHKVNNVAGEVRVKNSSSSSYNGNSSDSNHHQSSCVVPGIEHVFFETELDKMEHHVEEGQIVVLAVDASLPSEIAFKVYLEHVNRPGYILHVVHHSNYWGDLEPEGEAPTPKHCQDMVAKEDGRVKEVEAKYNKLMAENNIVGEFVVLHGKDAWHDVIQYQEKVKGIMIVMGTRGLNSLRRTFMGSVSDSVVHHASCPVLVCCHPKN